MLGLIVFGLYVSWDLNLIQELFGRDRTRISHVISAMLITMTLHAGYRSIFIARQFVMLDALHTRNGILTNGSATVTRAPFEAGCSLAQDFLFGSKADATLRAEVLAESARGSHQVGWFVTGAMLKLGLLGTVIGFVIMLSSIRGLEALELSDIKSVMQQMTEGMGIAMNTTIVGLVCSLLLGLQYLLLDRMADRFVRETLNLAERVKPDGAV